EADEMRTTDRDSHRAEILALTAVFLGVALMLRSLWLALAGEIALGVGIGWTFGWATFGAAAAFLVSIFTDFRGAAELGVIAGGGLLLCLLAGYVILPALLTLLPPKIPRVDDFNEHLGPPARGGARNFITPAIWLALLLAGVPFALRTDFDPGLLSLQSPNLESVKLVRKLQTWSAVVLSKDLDTLCRA